MATGDFDLYYPLGMWDSVAGGFSGNQRNWYDPDLRSVYATQAVYSRFVTTQFSLYDVRAPQMIITSLLPPNANNNSVDNRALWLPSSYIDSMTRVVNFQHYAAKLGLHKFDDLITFWKQDNVAGLSRIINRAIGPLVVELLDKLARNAFLSNSFAMYGTAGTATGFDGITTSDKITTLLLDDIHLGMAERGVPYAALPSGVEGNIVAITSPGVVHDLRQEASNSGNANAWVDTLKYSRPDMMMRLEQGSYHNVRFVQTPRAILYNCGNIDIQCTIAAAANFGDGSPDPTTTKVDGAFYTGQPSVVHYLSLSDFSPGDFEVNDRVTIHVARTNAFGITNGVDFRDGKTITRRIVAVDATANTISLDRPLNEEYVTDLGGGVYGYVTKGSNIHTMVVIGGQDGVVQGVSLPMDVKMPPPIDDTMSMYRVVSDGYFGYTVFEPQVFEAMFLAGTNREKGPAYIR